MKYLIFALFGGMIWVLKWLFSRPKDIKIVFDIKLEGDALKETVMDDIYITGSHDCLSQWSMPGKKCHTINKKNGSARSQLIIRVPEGTFFEYKICRGSWETEASTPRGRSYENFRFKAEKNSVVKHVITSWKDYCIHISQTHTLTGNFRSMGMFKSRFLKNAREILVYLPPGYESGSKRYPVIYFHDGNNVFDEATAFGGREWHVDEVAEYLINNKIIEPFIAVGVYNTIGREFEYTPVKSPGARGTGGGAELYAKFLAQELGPSVDKKFRTISSPHARSVAGSSFGGLVTLYLAACHGDYFGSAAAVSPSIWWANQSILKILEKADSKRMTKKIWLCMGGREAIGKPIKNQDNQKKGRYTFSGDLVFPDKRAIKEDTPETKGVESVYLVAKTLLDRGYDINQDLAVCFAPDAGHSEPDWARRIHAILIFLYGKTEFRPETLPVRSSCECYYGQKNSGELPNVRIEPLGFWRSAFFI